MKTTPCSFFQIHRTKEGAIVDKPTATKLSRGPGNQYMLLFPNGRSTLYVHHPRLEQPCGETRWLLKTGHVYANNPATQTESPPPLSDFYYREVCKTALLDPLTERSLFWCLNKHKLEAFKSKGQDGWNAKLGEAERVRNLIVKANLRLVVKRVKRSIQPGDDRWWDLIQVGNMALLSAVEDFDFPRGNKFSTHAFWRIRGALGEEYRKERVRHSHTRNRWETFLETLPEESFDSLQYTEALSVLDRCLEALPLNRRELLKKRFGCNGYHPHTLEEIGKERGNITGERVRQLEQGALKKIREYIAEEGIPWPL
ncbi:MAG: sigma-70 family RNA polymerase sigma factor [Candidatus Andersenbacteria bacterium]